MYDRQRILIDGGLGPAHRLLAGVLDRAFPGLHLAKPSTDPHNAPPPEGPATIAVFIADDRTSASLQRIAAHRAAFPDALLCVSGPSIGLARRRFLTDAGADVFCDLQTPGNLSHTVELVQRSLELELCATTPRPQRRSLLRKLAGRRDPLHSAA